MPAGIPWSDEDIATLTDLHTQGLSFSAIMRQFGGRYSRNAVIGKALRLNLPRRPDPSWNATQRAAMNPLAITGKAEHRHLPRSLKSKPLPPEKPIEKPPRRLADGSLVGTLELDRTMCRWPIGDPVRPDFHYCANERPEGEVYCAYHKKIAHQPQSYSRTIIERTAAA